MATVYHGGKKGLAKYMESKMSHGEATLERQHGTKTTANDVTRYMVTIPFPYFDPTSRTTHIVLACGGCEKVVNHWTGKSSEEEWAAVVNRRDQIYTEMGFFEHFKHCRAAQRLWNVRRPQRHESDS